MDAWEAWDLALHCLNQVRTAGMDGTVIGFDFAAVIAAGQAVGLSPATIATFLPAIEAGLLDALAERPPTDG